MEDWDTDIYTKGLDLVEACIRSAAQDSSNDTRFIGRSMFAAYTRALAHRAQAFLKRMDTSLQEKLNQATLTYIPGWQTQPTPSCSLLPTQLPPISHPLSLCCKLTLPFAPSPLLASLLLPPLTWRLSLTYLPQALVQSSIPAPSPLYPPDANPSVQRHQNMQ